MGPRSHAIHEWNYEVMVVGKDGAREETLAYANNFDIARAAFEASRHARSWSTIELRSRGRVVSVARTGGYDSIAQRVSQI